VPTPDRVAVLLDRDGTLIEDAGYPRDPGLVRLVPGAAEAMREFGRLGLVLVVVSNQSGVGRGLISPAEAAAVARRFEDCLLDRGVRLDASYYCFHAPWEGCPCRKPAPGLLLLAAAEHGIDLGRSFLVGDKAGDAEAGRRAGCSTLRFASPPSVHRGSPAMSENKSVLRFCLLVEASGPPVLDPRSPFSLQGRVISAPWMGKEARSCRILDIRQREAVPVDAEGRLRLALRGRGYDGCRSPRPWGRSARCGCRRWRPAVARVAAKA
jgi:D-glycero-D-manno-heptose 1,7-bisphosphate phosphatase